MVSPVQQLHKLLIVHSTSYAGLTAKDAHTLTPSHPPSVFLLQYSTHTCMPILCGPASDKISSIKRSFLEKLHQTVSPSERVGSGDEIMVNQVDFLGLAHAFATM